MGKGAEKMFLRMRSAVAHWSEERCPLSLIIREVKFKCTGIKVMDMKD